MNQKNVNNLSIRKNKPHITKGNCFREKKLNPRVIVQQGNYKVATCQAQAKQFTTKSEKQRNVWNMRRSGKSKTCKKCINPKQADAIN